MALSLNSEGDSASQLTAANLDAQEQLSTASAYTTQSSKSQRKRDRKAELRAQAAAKEAAEICWIESCRQKLWTTALERPDWQLSAVMRSHPQS